MKEFQLSNDDVFVQDGMNAEDDKLDKTGAMFAEKADIRFRGANKPSGFQGTRIENVNLQDTSRPSVSRLQSAKQDAPKKHGIFL